MARPRGKGTKQVRISKEFADTLETLKRNIELSYGKPVTITYTTRLLDKSLKNSGIVIIRKKGKKRIIEEMLP